ncbi:siderophore-interacting protein [Schaalia vaccimaxillae]|uniref:siderophore-interacting protein n=1 Tax=Schaalia vaccimaxillae TaxID=183916 RepID=UPI00047C986B|nr:siderophore-interacting protein [Schaalia vaccimaxillae]
MAETQPQPFGFFHVSVAGICDVTASMRRVTFTGQSLEHWADPGWDQRIKLVLPADEGGYAHLPMGPNWYRDFQALQPRQRCTIRTYTTRAVRHEAATGLVEVDVDMVRHGIVGPASRWIESAQAGDEVVLLGPDSRWEGISGGIDFVPPARTGAYLIGGDETAAPAIARILEDLPASATGIAVVEMPSQADVAYLPSHPGFDVRVVWRRSEAERGLMVDAVIEAAQELCSHGIPQDLEEIDVDQSLLWEVPRHAKGGAALKSASHYAWLAGEAGSVKAIRRHLVSEVGWDRRCVAFMGYWRMGRAEN